MNRIAAVSFSLVALLALQACATRGNQVEEPPAQQTAAANASAEPQTPTALEPAGAPGAERPSGYAGPGDLDRAAKTMGGALVGAAVGAGVGYYVVYSFGGPALVSMVGTPIVTGGAVVGAVIGLAKATPHR